MPGVIAEWPAWPEFVYTKSAEGLEDADYHAAKDAIIKEYGQAALTQSWLKTCAELENVTEEIIQKGRDIIPIIPYEGIESGAVSEEMVARLKKTGCFVVRDVIPRETVDKLFTDLKEYTAVNKGQYTAWPVDNPSIFNLVNTPTQNAARSHPNHLKLVRWINAL